MQSASTKVAQSGHILGLAPLAMYMPSFRPTHLGPPAQHASTEAELEELVRQCHDQEARELKVERRTTALDLKAVRDATVRAARKPYSGTGTLESQVVLLDVHISVTNSSNNSYNISDLVWLVAPDSDSDQEDSCF